MNRIAAVTCLREAIADLVEIGRMMSIKQDGWYAQRRGWSDLIDHSQAFARTQLSSAFKEQAPKSANVSLASGSAIRGRCTTER